MYVYLHSPVGWRSEVDEMSFSSHSTLFFETPSLTDSDAPRAGLQPDSINPVLSLQMCATTAFRQVLEIWSLILVFAYQATHWALSPAPKKLLLAVFKD